jgi:hypothetical protein
LLIGTIARSLSTPSSKGAFFNQDASLLVRAITAGGSSTINFATAMARRQP